MSYLRTDIIKKVAFSIRVDKAIKDLDCMFPSPYTKIIYNNLSKNNAAIIEIILGLHSRYKELYYLKYIFTPTTLYVYTPPIIEGEYRRRYFRTGLFHL